MTSSTTLIRDVSALISTGKMAEAEDLLKAWLLHKDDIWVRVELAKLKGLRGDWDERLEQFLAVVRDFPDEAVGYSYAIDAYRTLGRLDDAETLAVRAMRAYPRDAWIWDHAAQVAGKRGDAKAEFARWKAIAKFDPSHSRAITGMSTLLARLNRVDLIMKLHEGVDVDLEAVSLSNEDYLCPADVQTTKSTFRRALVIGSCMTASLAWTLSQSEPCCPVDHILINNLAALPDNPPEPIKAYDFVLVQLPLRVVIPEGRYFGLSYNKPEDYESLLQFSCEQLSRSLAAAMDWSKRSGILTFVTNFLVPQQNPLGRALPRYDLRNFVYFVERLNEHMSREIEGYKNTYFVDINQISSNIGKRFIQDDSLWVLSHGTPLQDIDYDDDQDRLETLQPASEYYPNIGEGFSRLLWREIEALYRTIQQIDVVKMVLVDLDDTLWRGVLADNGSTKTEGWPLGFVEALTFLKRRGVILGIVSKNTEDRIAELWPYNRLISLQDFAVRRINWKSKPENIEDILSEVNLLPKSVVYIDDNPVEREGVSQAFPDMRIVGSNPYIWRRILLWSPETQVANITDESARRSEMITAQASRDSTRKSLSKADFIASLEIQAKFRTISSTNDIAFPRAFELLNKTNQFNTTGVRWMQAEAEAYFSAGGVFYAMTVQDRFTDYGLVGVLCAKESNIDQFVMSCRVIGLDVEFAAVAHVVDELAAKGSAPVTASAIETSANLLSRDIWSRCNIPLAPVGRTGS